MDSRSPHNTPRRPGYRLRRPSQQARLPSKNRRIGYFVSIGAVLLATTFTASCCCLKPFAAVGKYLLVTKG